VIHIGNAPCSWGVIEGPGAEGQRLTFGRMLDELRDTGYTGTELGDWGFMPTDPELLTAELQSRGLSMIGSFVPVALRDASAHGPGEQQALQVARLLAAVAEQQPGLPAPVIVLADANCVDPVRTLHAGRITSDMGQTADEWATFASGAERIARSVLDSTGLHTGFHHHAAGFVETPDEVARLLDSTDPSVLGLTFDTGHYAFGTGHPSAAGVMAGLERFGDRIVHVHFKDCEAHIAADAHAAGWDYNEAVGAGLFCELGEGVVDFAAVRDWLLARDYAGWIVVEQDVLPGMGAPRESAARNRSFLRSIGL
jgi:inosose dehydratase